MERRRGLAVTAAMTLKLMSLRLATARKACKQLERARQQQANKAELFFPVSKLRLSLSAVL